jgi:pimeloyl-ACP methyl ester carboxylesterase
VSAPRPILIHGSGGGHRVWEPLAVRLAGAVAPELPGHPAGDPHRDVGGLAAALATALARTAGPRVLVGHSLGGAAAVEVARTRPDLVDGLVIVSSGARLPVPAHAMDRLRDDFPAERERLMAGFTTQPDGAAARAAREAIDACGPEVLRADYEACRTVDLRGRLGGVRVPALVVAGADDPLTPPWLSEELARELPHAHMVVIPGSRHLPMADAPATLAALVAAYLARLELTLLGA